MAANDAPRSVDTDEAKFPHVSIPTFYADGILNLANSADVAKFYLFRSDPTITSEEIPARLQAVAQVVMPISGFVRTALFFEKALKGLLDSGAVDRSDIEALRKVQE